MAEKITRIRAIATVAVVAGAAASGYFMQSHQAARPASEPTPVLTATRGQTVSLPALPARSGAADQPPALVTRAQPAPTLLPVAPPATLPAAPGMETLELAAANPLEKTPSAISDASCDIGFTSTALPGAMVELTLEAPCRAGETVDIFHDGSRFSDRLNENGLLILSVPALTEDADFRALLADGTMITTNAFIPTVANYRRIALTWKEPAGFALHAFENDAGFDSPDHLSAANTGDPSRALRGEGGFMSVLGGLEQGYRTMLYSWPQDIANDAPAPRISIEAEVRPETCGGEITATFIESVAPDHAAQTPLYMAVPGCEAIGTYLVLQNPGAQRKIAAN